MEKRKLFTALLTAVFACTGCPGRSGEGGVRERAPQPERRGGPPPTPNLPMPSPPKSADTLATLFARAGVENDPTMALFVRALTESKADAETTKNRLIGDLFSDSDEVQGKVFRLQVLVSALARNDLYTHEMRERVRSIQDDLASRIQSERRYDMLEKGALILGTGVLLGTLAGKMAYTGNPAGRARAVEPGAAASTAAAESPLRARLMQAYARGTQAIEAAREKLPHRDLIDRVINASTGRGTRAAERESAEAAERAAAAASATEAAAAASTTKPGNIETVFNHLASLGVPRNEQRVITTLNPVKLENVPAGVSLRPTNAPDFEYAVLSEWKRRNLSDAERVLLFKFPTAARGKTSDTYLVSNTVRKEEAEAIAEKLSVAESVSYVSARTGETRRLRWPASELRRLAAEAWAHTDGPTAVFTGILTSGAVGTFYYYGYNEGRDDTRFSGIDFEHLIAAGTGPYKAR